MSPTLILDVLFYIFLLVGVLLVIWEIRAAQRDDGAEADTDTDEVMHRFWAVARHSLRAGREADATTPHRCPTCRQTIDATRELL
jgi:hypothetical protein